MYKYVVVFVVVCTVVVGGSFTVSADGDSLSLGTELLGETNAFDADSDDDGLTDGEELQRYNSNPVKPDTDGDGLKDNREIEIGTEPIEQDTDGDGLSDRREYEVLQTDPVESDTDSDGLNDGVEVNGDTNPTQGDSDTDGLQDGAEVNQYGTDPVRADTDEDGLSDGDEVTQYDSDPLAKNTDNDSLTDGVEVQKYGTEPAKPDTDSDGLRDDAEVQQYGTNPAVADTDEDGLDDGAEIDNGTDPLNKDTDDDGLLDGQEVTLGANPLVTDTDNDGLDDGVEVNQYGTDPTEQDTDSDGVADRREIQLNLSPTDSGTDDDSLGDGTELSIGTEPLESDTDGDGLPDGFEYANSTNFQSDIDPLHKDVLVELDTDTSTDVPREIGLVVNEFENAPVSNPDGELGIDLHVYTSGSSISTRDTQSLNYYTSHAYKSQYDLDGYGFYHALIVENVKGESIGGVTSASIDGMLIQDSSNNERVASRFAHELGHQLGLMPSDFEGIDSAEYSFVSYPSTMNYNCRNQYKIFQPQDCGVVQYSTGTGFDDWEHIEQSLPNTHPSIEKID